jgi:hypothetical protein
MCDSPRVVNCCGGEPIGIGPGSPIDRAAGLSPRARDAASGAESLGSGGVSDSNPD